MELTNAVRHEAAHAIVQCLVDAPQLKFIEIKWEGTKALKPCHCEIAQPAGYDNQAKLWGRLLVLLAGGAITDDPAIQHNYDDVRTTRWAFSDYFGGGTFTPPKGLDIGHHEANRILLLAETSCKKIVRSIEISAVINQVSDVLLTQAIGESGLIKVDGNEVREECQSVIGVDLSTYVWSVCLTPPDEL